MTQIYDDACVAAQEALGPDRPMPVLQLDLQVVGERLIRLAATASMLGHAKPQNTLGYVRQWDQETEFVADILTLPTEKITEKWFCGGEGASRLMSAIAASAMNIKAS